MSIFVPTPPVQSAEAAAETVEQLIEPKQTRLTLRLEWFRLLYAGQDGPRLRARWRLK
jgi:hypothetical protein